MTIVAGFCANTGVVLAADSQEIISDYAKTTARKITVLHHGSEEGEEGGEWRVAIAGAAEDAAYLDLFEEELAGKIFELEEYDREKMRSVVKAVLHKLHKQHIWPLPDAKSPFQTLIVTQCVSEPKHPQDLQPSLLETKQSTVIATSGFRTVGVGTYMAKYLEQKFCNRMIIDSSLDHLGDVLILMLKEIKKAVSGCDGFTSVVLFYTDGRYRWMPTTEVSEVEKLSERLENISLSPLLALTDPNVTDEKFESIAKAASAEVEDLLRRRSQLVSQRRKAIDKMPSGRQGGRTAIGEFWEG